MKMEHDKTYTSSNIKVKFVFHYLCLQLQCCWFGKQDSTKSCSNSSQKFPFCSKTVKMP